MGGLNAEWENAVNWPEEGDGLGGNAGLRFSSSWKKKWMWRGEDVTRLLVNKEAPCVGLFGWKGWKGQIENNSLGSGEDDDCITRAKGRQ